MKDHIAIVGMAFRLPGASSVSQLHSTLSRQHVLTAPIGDARYELLGRSVGSVRPRAGLINDIEAFDADFFGISPREAALTDPHQRIMLELAWEAIESGGNSPTAYRGERVGVFATSHSNHYGDLLSAESGTVKMVGTAPASMAGRLSYLLGFQGPSVVLDSGCSSGLVALDAACDALALRKCDAAVVGGVNLSLGSLRARADTSYMGILSESGLCRAFDDRADGTSDGEGGVVFFVKRMEDALASGDVIYSSVRAISVNHNGSRSNGFSAPSPAAQESLLDRAWFDAGLTKPDSFLYIEAHGSGTRLGDAIELTALQRALARRGMSAHVSSLKSNIGHLDQVAGLAGMVKAILSLHLKKRFASANFEKPNSLVNWDGSVEITTSESTLESPEGVVGVSSLSLTGTNVHVILGPPPAVSELPNVGFDDRVLTISATSDTSLVAFARQVRRSIADSRGDWLAIVRTLNTGRGRHKRVRTFDASDVNILLERLYEFEISPSGIEARADSIDDASNSPAPFQRVVAPTYPFARTRHWPVVRIQAERETAETVESRSADVDPPDSLAIVGRIWQAVLGVQEYDETSDYFSLGGNSVLALELLASLERTTGVRLRLVDLYKASTLGAMARLVDQSDRDRGLNEDQVIVAKEAEVATTRPSFGQESLWLVGQSWPESNAYNIAVDVPLVGHLDLQALRLAFQDMTERHEPLRSRLIYENDQLEVRFGDAADLNFRVVDHRESRGNDAERWELAWEELTREARLPFDISVDMPFRVRIYQLSDQNYLLLMVTHHTVDDGWSPEIFGRDLREFYSARLRGMAPDLPALPVTYSDFAAWQRDFWTPKRLEIEKTFWKHNLSQLAPLEIATDYPRPQVASDAGDHIHFTIDRVVTSQIRNLASRLNVSPFCVIMTAYKATISRWSGQVDVTVGITTAGRDQPEVRDLVGYFNNAVALRSDLTGNPTFEELVLREHQVISLALGHDMVPFAEVVAASGLRDLSRHPIFQAGMTYQRLPASPLHFLDGVSVDPAQPARIQGVAIGTAKWDLDLGIWDRDGSESLPAVLEYRSDLWRVETMKSFVDSLAELLRDATSDSSTPLGELSVVAATQMQTELALARSSQAEISSLSVLQIFEERCRRDVEDDFVLTESVSVSPNEVRSKASNLSRILQQIGVRGGDRVITELEPGVDLVAAILGIWMCGASWVPVTDMLPPARKEQIHRITRAVATVASTGPDGTSDSSWDVKPLGDVSRLLGEVTKDAPLSDAAQEAYVLFTSGSTGQPKAVSVSHRSLATYAQHWASRLGERVRLLSTASPLFDVFIGDLARAIASSGTLIYLSPEVVATPELLAVQMLTHQVDAAEIVPSRSRRALVDWAERTNTELPLAVVLVGGDSWNQSEMRKTRKVLKAGARTITTYGVTEATIDSLFQIDEIDMTQPSGAQLPIGLPLDGVVVYLMNESATSPVPPGSVGEICVGGELVAAGYIGQPALTADRFVPDPFRSGQRLYRTGDLGRRVQSGAITFLGRRDRELKVNGVRISPDAVESAIKEFSGVNDSVVAVVPRGAAGEALGALVEVSPGSGLEPSSFREQLADLLPRHHVPGIISFLSSIPRLSNGKPDVSCAQSMLAESPVVGASGDGPIGELESEVADMWSSLLGVRVGRGDDFFALGGTSLIAVSLLGRVNSKFNLRLSLSTILRASTVSELSKIIESSQTPIAANDRLIPLNSEFSSGPPLYLVHPSGGQVIAYSLFARELSGQKVIGLTAAGHEGQGSYETLETYANELVELISNDLETRMPLRIAGWSFGGVVAYEVARQWNRLGRPVEYVALFDSSIEEENLKYRPDSYADLLLAIFESALDLTRRHPRLASFEAACDFIRQSGVVDDLTTNDELLDLVESNVAHDKLLDKYSVETHSRDLDLVLYRCSSSLGASDLGWSRFAKSLRIVDVPGTHYDLFKNHSAELAASVLRDLREI